MGSLKTLEQFVEDSKRVHNGKYRVCEGDRYVNNYTPIKLICPIHGEFAQTPKNHLSGKGCPKCARLLKHPTKKDTKQFIAEAKAIHGDRYDYSKVEYTLSREKVVITCSIHGDFEQYPYLHLQGCGCPKCAQEENASKKRKTLEEFVSDAIKVHGDRYDYSKVEYVNARTTVDLICKEHGVFKQMPYHHLNGCGCPKCSTSKLENAVILMLEENGIEYVYEKRFPWLGLQSIDFYIPKYNVGIECQGLEHFKPCSFGNTKKGIAEKNFEYVQKMDARKRQLCKENGVKLLYYSDLGIEYPYDVIEDKERLLKEVLNA